MVRGPVSISDAFGKGRPALIGYLPAGFPSVDGAVEAITAMVSAGVDAVEVGWPYSDPVMDGPVIQRAAEAALAAGVRSADVLRTVERVAAAGAPVVVMTYWNPVERYGVDRFARDLASAGGAGLITPDLIPDEGAEWIAAAEAHGLDRIFLVSPSSTDSRLAATVKACRGFVYATSVMGVTGAREQTPDAAPALVARVRAVSATPVAVGLGVSTGAQAAVIGRYADGVIVGSALVRALAEGGVSAVGALAEDLVRGVAADPAG